MAYSAASTYSAQFNETGTLGVYGVVFAANDSKGNSNESQAGSFSIVDTGGGNPVGPGPQQPETTQEPTTRTQTTTTHTTTRQSSTTTVRTSTTAQATTSVATTTSVKTTDSVATTEATPTREKMPPATDSNIIDARKSGSGGQSDPCANGVLDAQEDGVDCGGPCPPCATAQISLELKSLRYLNPGEKFTLEVKVKAEDAPSQRLTLRLSASEGFEVTPSAVVDTSPVQEGQDRTITWQIQAPAELGDEEGILTVSVSDKTGEKHNCRIP